MREISTLPPSFAPLPESSAAVVQRQPHIQVRPRQPEWRGGRLSAEERSGTVHRQADVSQAAVTIQRLPITVGKKKIDTDDYESFTKAVNPLSSANLSTVKAELLGAIGDNQEEATKHKKHIEFLDVAITRAQSAEDLIGGEESSQKQKAAKQQQQLERREKGNVKQQQQQEEARRKSAQTRLGKAYVKIDPELLTTLLETSPLPDEAIFKLFSRVWTQLAAGDRAGWSALFFKAISTYKMEPAALGAMLDQMKVLDFSTCQDAIESAQDRQHCSADTVRTWGLAVKDRGNAPGRVPDSLDISKLRQYALRQRATLEQIQLLSHATHRTADWNALLSLIISKKLDAPKVTTIDGLWEISLPVCSDKLAQVSGLTPVRIAVLNQSAATVKAGGKVIDGALLLSMIGTLNQPAAPASPLGPAGYVANVTLYPNLLPTHIEQIVQQNGSAATVMLQKFNQVVVGCPANIAWGLRDDLKIGIAPGDAPTSLYAPTMLGNWYLHWELIADQLGWRGAGGHGFTFAQIESAKSKAAGNLKPNDMNQAFKVPAVGATIVLNWAQSKIITMYS